VTFEPKRVVLTGGAGFIGSHVAEALLSHGIELMIVDNLDRFYSTSQKKANLKRIRQKGKFTFVNQDIRSGKGIRELMRRGRPDVVIHLAARAGVRPSIKQPLLYQSVNVHGTLSLLELCRELGVGKFIFASSSSVYGAPAATPFSEDYVDLRPISPYGVTKLAGERLCYTYAHLFHLRVICLRLFTVYGPRQRPDLAIRRFTALIEAGKPLPIFGDGSAARDYTYVADVVAGVLAALRYEPNQEPRFEIINLGNSHPAKLSELVELLEKTIQRKAIFDRKPFPPGDVPFTWADISKAGRLLGYRPQMPLEKGLKEFVAWFRSEGLRL
jgi:UDP-glucuronate 4-epimerase